MLPAESSYGRAVLFGGVSAILPYRSVKLAKDIIAVVGGETLLGREVREVLESVIPMAIMKPVAAIEEARVLTEQEGEPIAMSPLLPDEIAPAQVVILAGGPESSRKAYEYVAGGESEPLIIDLTCALEDKPEARLRAPQAEGLAAKSGSSKLYVVAHPAAIALAICLKRLQTVSPIHRCVAVVFEPASERGQKGLDELQQQTVGLLSFQKLNKAVYDAQVSFNLLPAYGEEAPRALEDIELNIDRHLASLLSKDGLVPMPSLRVIQAPVFHGYSFSLWVEFEHNPDVAGIVKKLASEKIDVRTWEHEAPSNVGVAGQSGITVGAIAADRNDPRGCWLWVVADNLRIAAENAVEVANEYLS
jgi:aspartate-semialdehyde dehydrogenase